MDERNAGEMGNFMATAEGLESKAGRQEMTRSIPISIAIQTLSMVAGAVILVAVAESLNWWMMREGK